MNAWPWVVRGKRVLPSERTLVMGILNVTPDSFSDGGSYANPRQAVDAALRMIEEGADIIDVGGESSRPGRAGPVSVEEELRRVKPVVELLRKESPDVLISVDTYKAPVVEQVLDCGADIINDIYALRFSPETGNLVVRYNAGLILMHMQGTPETMQQSPTYRDVVVDVKHELRECMDAALSLGVPEEAIAIDPGFGFGKTVDHNVQLLAGLEYLRLLQRPICVGISRKSFLGALLGGADVSEREEATIAAQVIAVLHGASIVRTHNVKNARRSLAVVDAVMKKM